MLQPNETKFALELLSIQGTPHIEFERNPISRSRDTSEQKFAKISSFFSSSSPSSSSSSSFRTLCKNCYNSWTRAPILLKFGPRFGGHKANSSINFGANPFNIQGVISSFTRKTMSKVCHAYRPNHLEEQATNWYVAGLNIRGVPFGG